MKLAECLLAFQRSLETPWIASTRRFFGTEDNTPASRVSFSFLKSSQPSSLVPPGPVATAPAAKPVIRRDTTVGLFERITRERLEIDERSDDEKLKQGLQEHREDF